jgi:hypothetical protein
MTRKDRQNSGAANHQDLENTEGVTEVRKNIKKKLYLSDNVAFSWFLGQR